MIIVEHGRALEKCNNHMIELQTTRKMLCVTKKRDNVDQKIYFFLFGFIDI